MKRGEKGDRRRDMQQIGIQFRGDVRKRERNSPGRIARGTKGREDNDMASSAGGEERRKFEAVDRASNSKGLRRLAVRQDANSLVCCSNDEQR